MFKKTGGAQYLSLLKDPSNSAASSKSKERYKLSQSYKNDSYSKVIGLSLKRSSKNLRSSSKDLFLQKPKIPKPHKHSKISSQNSQFEKRSPLLHRDRLSRITALNSPSNNEALFASVKQDPFIQKSQIGRNHSFGIVGGQREAQGGALGEGSKKYSLLESSQLKTNNHLKDHSSFFKQKQSILGGNSQIDPQIGSQVNFKSSFSNNFLNNYQSNFQNHQPANTRQFKYQENSDILGIKAQKDQSSNRYFIDSGIQQQRKMQLKKAHDSTLLNKLRSSSSSLKKLLNDDTNSNSATKAKNHAGTFKSAQKIITQSSKLYQTSKISASKSKGATAIPSNPFVPVNSSESSFFNASNSIEPKINEPYQQSQIKKIDQIHKNFLIQGNAQQNQKMPSCQSPIPFSKKFYFKQSLNFKDLQHQLRTKNKDQDMSYNFQNEPMKESALSYNQRPKSSSNQQRPSSNERQLQKNIENIQRLKQRAENLSAEIKKKRKDFSSDHSYLSLNHQKRMHTSNVSNVQNLLQAQQGKFKRERLSQTQTKTIQTDFEFGLPSKSRTSKSNNIINKLNNEINNIYSQLQGPNSSLRTVNKQQQQLMNQTAQNQKVGNQGDQGYSAVKSQSYNLGTINNNNNIKNNIIDNDNNNSMVINNSMQLASPKFHSRNTSLNAHKAEQRNLHQTGCSFHQTGSSYQRMKRLERGAFTAGLATGQQDFNGGNSSQGGPVNLNSSEISQTVKPEFSDIDTEQLPGFMNPSNTQSIKAQPQGQFQQMKKQRKKEEADLEREKQIMNEIQSMNQQELLSIKQKISDKLSFISQQPQKHGHQKSKSFQPVYQDQQGKQLGLTTQQNKLFSFKKLSICTGVESNRSNKFKTSQKQQKINLYQMQSPSNHSNSSSLGGGDLQFNKQRQNLYSHNFQMNQNQSKNKQQEGMSVCLQLDNNPSDVSFQTKLPLKSLSSAKNHQSTLPKNNLKNLKKLKNFSNPNAIHNNFFGIKSKNNSGNTNSLQKRSDKLKTSLGIQAQGHQNPNQNQATNTKPSTLLNNTVNSHQINDYDTYNSEMLQDSESVNPQQIKQDKQISPQNQIIKHDSHQNSYKDSHQDSNLVYRPKSQLFMKLNSVQQLTEESTDTMRTDLIMDSKGQVREEIEQKLAMENLVYKPTAFVIDSQLTGDDDSSNQVTERESIQIHHEAELYSGNQKVSMFQKKQIRPQGVQQIDLSLTRKVARKLSQKELDDDGQQIYRIEGQELYGNQDNYEDDESLLDTDKTVLEIKAKIRELGAQNSHMLPKSILQM